MSSQLDALNASRPTAVNLMWAIRRMRAALRAAGPELIGAAKVLLLSGYAPESVQKVIDNIPVSFLSKPVGARALAERVKELLAA
jgi:hypothetical protein